MTVEEVLKLKPINNKIILKQDLITVSNSGILIVPDAAEKQSFCTVISADSELIKSGMVVYVDPYTGIKLCKTDDAIYSLVNEDDILGILVDKIN